LSLNVIYIFEMACSKAEGEIFKLASCPKFLRNYLKMYKKNKGKENY